MLLPVVAEQLRHFARRADSKTKAVRAVAGSGGGKIPPRASTTSTTPTILEVPRGTRYQLFRALRAMAAGQFMLVEHRIPALPDHGENPLKRTELVRSLHNIASWQSQNDIEPVLVPGTPYPFVIGRILIRSGWCAPSPRPHWVPNLRFFFLTDLGHESFLRAQAWWSELTTLERMRLMLLE